MSDWSFFWTCLAFVSIPHWLYVWLWTLGHDAWMKIFGKNSVSVFAGVASGLKVVQFTAAALWYFHTAPKTDAGFLHSLMQLNPLVILLALAFLGFGQLLNAAIYQRIGKAGVYYGVRLGVEVPWVEGFPFNVVSHPQYVGSVLSVWGVYLLTCLRSQELEIQGLVGCIVVSLLYAMNAVVEQYHELPGERTGAAAAGKTGGDARRKKRAKKSSRKAD